MVPQLRARSRVTVSGVVQGVGFRPFVYALARELALAGQVLNNSAGVVAEVEGDPGAVAEFTRRLRADAPPLAQVDSVVAEPIAVRGGTEFVIVESQTGQGRTMVSPDVATCGDCLAEMRDPADRRYRHPFISCTNCGPRFTVIVDLPYDRPATTMAPLPLCERCAAEYADPADRRFHAQTVACPDCGPTLRLRHAGADAVGNDAALAAARRLLREGAVVAVKGLGGYHLACDASSEQAVARLRKAKDRGDKPFAVMVADLADARQFVVLGEAEQALLTDPRRPVVLARRRPGTDPGTVRLAPSVAPDHPDLGIMLAYTPVHHLLFGLPGDPVGPRVLVMTSGNLSGEPIVTDDAQAIERLAPLADAWLAHDRAIVVPCDDSVMRVTGTTVLPVRRSRGYAPLPVALPFQARPSLAVGGDLKNTFCLASGRYAWMSAHIGDMDDLATQRAFGRAVGHLGALTGVAPEVIVTDRHPGYRTVAWARENAGDAEIVTVQHHHAHIASAMADNGHTGASPVIGFAFDGTGYGEQGAVWGGEVLVADYAGFERVAHLRYTPLPGGDAGVRNTCRMALSHLRTAGIAWDERLPPVAACDDLEVRVLARQMQTGLATVPTSSMGRLFDAMSSLAGVCHRVAYEAEAAMRFEELAAERIDDCPDPYGFGLVESPDGGPLLADPAPVIARAADDVLAGVAAPVIGARFHLAVVDLVVGLAERLRDDRGLSTVALSGGVFLNALLTGKCVERLQARGFAVLRHRMVPPSDAGLALGQLAVAAHHGAG